MRVEVLGVGLLDVVRGPRGVGSDTGSVERKGWIGGMEAGLGCVVGMGMSNAWLRGVVDAVIVAAADGCRV